MDYNGPPICWLRGPAGSGKSAIAHTIADRCHQQERLAATFFFSRGKEDRSDISKLVPTLAFQLAKRISSIRPLLLEALLDESTLSQTFRDQFSTLIVTPLISIEQPDHRMLIIIDGLDECAAQDTIVTLIKLLGQMNWSHRFPVRFFLVSRPETQIRDAFRLFTTQDTVFTLHLEDFTADNDIRTYLRKHLSEIRKKRDLLMQDIPTPWPSEVNLDTLVRQSEGLFIYVSTLVRFVDDDEHGLPQEKLENVLKIHTGVDSLYGQIIFEARKYRHFDQVMGSLMYLHRPLSISQLAELLHLQAAHIHQAMQGCHSILTVPDNNNDPIRTYHASLRDFLTNYDRSQRHFLDPVKCHALISTRCLEVITVGLKNTMQGGQPLSYACEAWHHHCCLLLSCADYTLDEFKSHLSDLQIAMKDIDLQWLKYWIYQGLTCQGLMIQKTNHNLNFVSLLL
jgi:hypothetical protein